MPFFVRVSAVLYSSNFTPRPIISSTTARTSVTWKTAWVNSPDHLASAGQTGDEFRGPQPHHYLIGSVVHKRSRARVQPGAMTSKIEDYAIIGDTKTVAVVDLTGSIDCWCVPRIDSGAELEQEVRIYPIRTIHEQTSTPSA
jgi:hypothetical protein